MTQHQMRNIGNGNDPNAPLTYKVEAKLPHFIGTMQAYINARAPELAQDWGERYFGSRSVSVTLL